MVSLSPMTSARQEATTLERENYSEIQAAMAHHDRQHGALAATPIDDEHIKDGFPWLIGESSFDRTLTSQLRHLLAQDNRPDLYLFTAKSAIPVADTFRGIFGDDNPPSLGYIKASSKSAFPYIDQFMKPPNHTSIAAHQAEVERLRKLTQTAPHVCVVEQYSDTGKTLRYAGLLLKEAGVQTVSGIRGQWYHEARKEDVDKHGLTSTHAQFMHGVGELIKEQLAESLNVIRT